MLHSKKPPRKKIKNNDAKVSPSSFTSSVAATSSISHKKSAQHRPKDAGYDDPLTPSKTNLIRNGVGLKKRVHHKEKSLSDGVIELTSTSEDESVGCVKHRKRPVKTTPNTRRYRHTSSADVIDLSTDEDHALPSRPSPRMLFNKAGKSLERTPDSTSPCSSSSLKRELSRRAKFADNVPSPEDILPAVEVHSFTGSRGLRNSVFPARTGSLTQRLFSQSFLQFHTGRTVDDTAIAPHSHNKDKSIQKLPETPGDNSPIQDQNKLLDGWAIDVQKQLLPQQIDPQISDQSNFFAKQSVPPSVDGDEANTLLDDQALAQELERKYLRSLTPEPERMDKARTPSVLSAAKVPVEHEPTSLMESPLDDFAPVSTPEINYLSRTQTSESVDTTKSPSSSLSNSQASVEKQVDKDDHLEQTSSASSLTSSNDSPPPTTPDSNDATQSLIPLLTPDLSLNLQVHKILEIPTLPFPDPDDSDDFLLSQGLLYPESGTAI